MLYLPKYTYHSWNQFMSNRHWHLKGRNWLPWDGEDHTYQLPQWAANQILKLEITTTIHMSHGKCNDKLQIWDLLSDYVKYLEYESHTLTRKRDMNNETKWADLTLGCPTLAGTVILETSCAPGTIYNCHWVQVLTQWVESVTLHSSVLPRLPWGILGLPLSCIG